MPARPLLARARAGRRGRGRPRRSAGASRGSRSITRHASRSRSTKTQREAPRESASRPIAPEPANRSSTRAPSTGPDEANAASRTRSPVGRVTTPFGAAIPCPLREPATILNVGVSEAPRRPRMASASATSPPTIAAAGSTSPASPTLWPAYSESASMSPVMPLERQPRRVADDRRPVDVRRDRFALPRREPIGGAPAALPAYDGVVPERAMRRILPAEVEEVVDVDRVGLRRGEQRLADVGCTGASSARRNRVPSHAPSAPSASAAASPRPSAIRTRGDDRDRHCVETAWTSTIVATDRQTCPPAFSPGRRRRRPPQPRRGEPRRPTRSSRVPGRRRRGCAPRHGDGSPTRGTRRERPRRAGRRAAPPGAARAGPGDEGPVGARAELVDDAATASAAMRTPRRSRAPLRRRPRTRAVDPQRPDGRLDERVLDSAEIGQACPHAGSHGAMRRPERLTTSRRARRRRAGGRPRRRGGPRRRAAARRSRARSSSARSCAQAREAEVGEARLARAEQLALAADLEVALGELEAVGRRDERLQPRRAPRSAPRVGRETSRQYDCSAPRPTRPRSWWSCARPKRSASWTIMIVAFGTSTPTSITVVATSTSSSPRLEPRHQLAPLRRAAAGRAGSRRGSSRSSARRSRSASASAARATRRLRLLDQRADDVRLPALVEVPRSRVYASGSRSSVDPAR